MAVRRLAPKELQPANFTFSAENLAWAQKEIAKYPEGRQASAVIPILWRGPGKHEGGGFQGGGPPGAGFLCVRPIRPPGVAALLTMFLPPPVGKKAHAPVCGTPP